MEYTPEFVHWRSVTDYKPSAVIMALQTQFNEVEWTHGGYGGRAWGGIVDCAATYYELDNLTAFIDHVLDVEHNGGSLFDKQEAAGFVGLYMDWKKADIHSFLDWKFHSPDLVLDNELYEHYGYCLSAKTLQFINRFANVYLPKNERSPIQCGLKLQRARYDKPADNGALYYEPLYWEDNESGFYLEDSEHGSVCEKCGDFLYEGDECPSESGYIYCEHCYHNKYTFCEGSHEMRQDEGIYLDSGVYCEECAEIDHALCDECEEWHDKGNSFHFAGEDYCEDCIDLHANECENCDILILEEDNDSDPPRCDECAKLLEGSPFEHQYHTILASDNISMLVENAEGIGYKQYGLELDYTNPRTPLTIPVQDRGQTLTKQRLDKLGIYSTVRLRFSSMGIFGAVCEGIGEPRGVITMWDYETAFSDPSKYQVSDNGWGAKSKFQSNAVFEIVLVSDNEPTV
jgi:hypothetical protein